MLISTFPTKGDSFILSTINSNDNISFLKKGKQVVNCAHKTVYSEGEELSELFYLISGKVILHKNDCNGEKIKLYQLKEGSFFGLNTLFDFSKASHSATIIKNSLLLVIPKVEFKELITRWPSLKKQIIYQLIHQLDLIEKTIS